MKKAYFIVQCEKVDWFEDGPIENLEEAVYTAVDIYDRLAPVDKERLEDMFILEAEEVNGEFELYPEDGEIHEVVSFDTIKYGKGVQDASYKSYDLEEAKSHYIDYVNSLVEVDEDDKARHTEFISEAGNFKQLVRAVDDLYKEYGSEIKKQLVLELLYM